MALLLDRKKDGFVESDAPIARVNRVPISVLMCTYFALSWHIGRGFTGVTCLYGGLRLSDMEVL